jgi:hypothetical protein
MLIPVYSARSWYDGRRRLTLVRAPRLDPLPPGLSPVNEPQPLLVVLPPVEALSRETPFVEILFLPLGLLVVLTGDNV